jgi:AcrR family transcriptional regulator
MAKVVVQPDSEKRRHILQAALKRFAHCGYSAASVQQIVDDAKVSKPTLYYYFKDKSDLFRALVHEAHDERYRLLQEAAARRVDIRGQLEEILTALFAYFHQNRELMRIAFATMLAAPGEMPDDLCYADKCERNFEFIHTLIRQAQKAGDLDKRFDARELAFGFYGLANFYLVSNLVMSGFALNPKTAVRVVDLFLSGASPQKKK